MMGEKLLELLPPSCLLHKYEEKTFQLSYLLNLSDDLPLDITATFLGSSFLVLDIALCDLQLDLLTLHDIKE